MAPGANPTCASQLIGRAAYPRARRLSVRRGVALALALLAVIALGQLVVNLQAFASAAYLLRRAEVSYRQLGAYQQLSIDLLEYIRVVRDTPPSGALDTQRRLVIGGMAGLDALSGVEIGLVRDNGIRESRSLEDNRLRLIRAGIERLLAAPVPQVEIVYENDVKPLLVQAVEGEEGEVGEVERAMRALKTSMSVSGPFGVLLQIAAAVVVVVLVSRLVLDPLSRLVADIRTLGRGALAHRVEVTRHDEFGLLAQHINRMAGSLEQGRRSLIETNDRLESIVEERTAALSERNVELKEIDESRRRFFADVSHELRTPLTAIVGEADVTLRIADTAVRPYRDALSSILANSTYLNRRIDDLMALARSSDGQLELEHRPVDLDLVASDAMAEIRSLARINEVEVRLASADRALPIRGDRGRLRQGMMILLDNAVKFSRGGGEVVLRLERDGDHATISVIDGGGGIPVEELPHVFERFYQTEVGKRLGGTGLGLAIARRIAEAHGGSIEAASDEAGGTRVTLSLPLDLDSAA